MMDSLGNMPKAVYIESAPVAAAVVADTTKKAEPATPANSSSSTSNHSNHNKH